MKAAMEEAEDSGLEISSYKTPKYEVGSRDPDKDNKDKITTGNNNSGSGGGISANIDAALDWIRQHTTMVRHAKGGLNDYTGWAWMDGTLQEPELVLNSTDTQRMFDIIDAERSISTPMLSNIVSLIDTLANIQGINSRRFDFNNGEPQAQNITINADFPNVSSRDEIKAAFGDMMNMASQYINSTV